MSVRASHVKAVVFVLCPDRSARSTRKAFHVCSTLVANSQLSYALMARQNNCQTTPSHAKSKALSLLQTLHKVSKSRVQSVPAPQRIQSNKDAHKASRPTSFHGARPRAHAHYCDSHTRTMHRGASISTAHAHCRRLVSGQGTEAPTATYTRATSHLVQRPSAPTFHASRTDGSRSVLLAAHAQTPINPPLNCLDPSNDLSSGRRTGEEQRTTKRALGPL